MKPSCLVPARGRDFSERQVRRDCGAGTTFGGSADAGRSTTTFPRRATTLQRVSWPWGHLTSPTGDPLLPVAIDLERRPVIGSGGVDLLYLSFLILHLDRSADQLHLGRP